MRTRGRTSLELDTYPFKSIHPSIPPSIHTHGADRPAAEGAPRRDGPPDTTPGRAGDRDRDRGGRDHDDGCAQCQCASAAASQPFSACFGFCVWCAVWPLVVQCSNTVLYTLYTLYTLYSTFRLQYYCTDGTAYFYLHVPTQVRRWASTNACVESTGTATGPSGSGPDTRVGGGGGGRARVVCRADVWAGVLLVLVGSATFTLPNPLPSPGPHPAAPPRE